MSAFSGPPDNGPHASRSLDRETATRVALRVEMHTIGPDSQNPFTRVPAAACVLLACGLLAVACAAGISAAMVTADERMATPSGEIVIRPLAHASVRIDFAGRVIYVDPWSGAGLEQQPLADLIVVTDADAGAHHLDPAAIRRLRKPGAPVVIPASGLAVVPDGIVMNNDARRAFGNVTVEATAAYDVTPGAPFHAKGVANGYILTLGGKRLLFAGVTECVPEIRVLANIDVAFLPMNLPNGRMTPSAVAACVRTMRPKVAYPYHYDQGYIGRLAGRGAPTGGADAAESVRSLATLLAGVAEVRAADWYPPR